MLVLPIAFSYFLHVIIVVYIVIQFDFSVCARTLLRSALGVLVANVISGTIFVFFSIVTLVLTAPPSMASVFGWYQNAGTYDIEEGRQ